MSREITIKLKNFKSRISQFLIKNVIILKLKKEAQIMSELINEQ
jgi:hypothetical protein